MCYIPLCSNSFEFATIFPTKDNNNKCHSFFGLSGAQFYIIELELETHKQEKLAGAEQISKVKTTGLSMNP